MHNYYASLDAGVLPVQKGVFLSDDDARFGKYIIDISCKGRTEVLEDDMKLLDTYSQPLLTQLIDDGLVVKDKNRIEVTPVGRNFVRNICSIFDLHLAKNRLDKDKNVFSKAV
jgi:oxygen-independent coproporphyrinogen-3 oxidase